MLSHKVLTRQDVGRAASYYEDSADDYYSKEGDASEWQGLGAETLGLQGAVDSARFRELLSGIVEPGSQPIRGDTRKDSNSRIGIDFTFSAPKSVSLQALVSGDVEIIRAHDRAVSKAIEAAEQRAQARRKVAGISMVENTGNLVVAKFRHETSRERDPQLHTHAVIMNMTQRSDGEWRALKNDELVKMNKYLGLVYRAELAAELQKLGYSLQHDRDGMFELAHISRDQLEAFSQRSAQIEERLAAKGLTRETASAAEKQKATMDSRARKVSIEREEVFRDWQDRAKDLGIDFERREWAGRNLGGVETSHDGPTHEMAADVAAKYAVRWAVKHLTERQSVMSEAELLSVALNQSMGAARSDDVLAEVRRQTERGYLLKEDPVYVPADNIGKHEPLTAREHIEALAKKGMPLDAAKARVELAIERGSLALVDYRYTTQTALARERTILQAEKNGRGAVEPALSKDSQGLLKVLLDQTPLTSGQRGAVELITTTPNRIVGVQGLAGTGKSTMLETAKIALEAEGYSVRALAPYGAQVKALREAGTTANTLASFLAAKDKKLDNKTVLVVDEAGVVPTRQMEQLLKAAEKAGARVVLLGDTAQTKAIEAGRPFDQLQAAGMATAKMEQIQRQKNQLLKEAVEHAAQGKTQGAISRISHIVEVENDALRREALAKDYLKLQPEERDNTIVVAGTNEARHHLNALIRQGMNLDGRGQVFDTLSRRDTTQAERKFAKYYRLGDYIQPERDYPKSGLVKGELYKIVEKGPGNRLVLESPEGELAINPMQHKQLSVYERARTELSEGEKIRITRNDARMDLANGDRFTVEKVTDTEVTLRSDTRTVTLKTDKPLHVDYAYASTVHGSQGLTADRVMIDANSKSRTTAKDTFYVAISRARHSAMIYTDSEKDLPKAIARDNVKLAALDLARSKQASGKVKQSVAPAKEAGREGERKAPVVERSNRGGRERVGRA